ncbi:hypothetical protein HZS_8165 [Henneguya salminicola]|nr:hypothetical protein HZS_8165 [Henneguya salminicola]
MNEINDMTANDPSKIRGYNSKEFQQTSNQFKDNFKLKNELKFFGGSNYPKKTKKCRKISNGNTTLDEMPSPYDKKNLEQGINYSNFTRGSKKKNFYRQRKVNKFRTFNEFAGNPQNPPNPQYNDRFDLKIFNKPKENYIETDSSGEDFTENDLQRYLQLKEKMELSLRKKSFVFFYLNLKRGNRRDKYQDVRNIFLIQDVENYTNLKNIEDVNESDNRHYEIAYKIERRGNIVINEAQQLQNSYVCQKKEENKIVSDIGIGSNKFDHFEMQKQRPLTQMDICPNIYPHIKSIIRIVSSVNDCTNIRFFNRTFKKVGKKRNSLMKNFSLWKKQRSREDSHEFEANILFIITKNSLNNAISPNKINIYSAKHDLNRHLLISKNQKKDKDNKIYFENLSQEKNKEYRNIRGNPIRIQIRKMTIIKIKLPVVKKKIKSIRINMYFRSDIPLNTTLDKNQFSTRTFLDLSNADEEKLQNLKNVEIFNRTRKDKGKLSAMMNSQWKIYLYRTLGVPLKRIDYQ